MDGLPDVDLDILNVAIPPSFNPAAPSTQEASASDLMLMHQHSSNSTRLLFTLTPFLHGFNPPLSSSHPSPPLPAPPTMVLQHVRGLSSEALPVNEDEQGISSEAAAVGPTEAISDPPPMPTTSRQSHNVGQAEDSGTPLLEEGHPKRVLKKPACADATLPWKQKTLPSVETQSRQACTKSQMVGEKQKENDGSRPSSQRGHMRKKPYTFLS
ncbi:uncharacterized protein LAESUDRAFT_718685 [Laetiporus sulphureus 93-53]|uniref:Uncharacterized protein n=1 Tax=Laetiporus sulphureus 93-53 TaxID=1314785 RepID=A0A165API7_9APHY|nr:uncharacterized protein LAESUDRAFT_718685 [Laetiporus sulphureus 93-53]KZS99406.1 hypothetical protein LAESUDRAFT_718685 [Laetiporus sulphureus 93-53]